MKLLLYSWQANNERVLADNLSRLGFDVVWFEKKCRHYTRDMELAAEMIPRIHEEKAEAVISFNYFPIISMICDTCKIPYYAWVYDCPHYTLYAKHIMLACNHIGIFDKEMAHRLEAGGVHTVSHVPLSVDTDFFGKRINRASRKERERYRCDISFVGSLYTNEYNYYDRIFHNGKDEEDTEKVKNMTDASYMPDALVNAMDGLIQKQCFNWRKDYLSEETAAGRINTGLLKEKMEQDGLMLGEDYFAKPEDILLASVLEKKVTVEERRQLLEKIAAKLGGEYRFHLYTNSDLDGLPSLRKHNRGIADYHGQMPLVFAKSRINLNISLRSIHSGIPLRVLDIMACGGFALTNRQPEIAEYFREDEEIVMFQSLDECVEKALYYLQHEDDRQKIAAAGHRKVKEEFSYRAGFERLFGISIPS